LVLRVHSPGGSVLDGNAIFTALRQHPGGVTTHIDGLAASMASVIALAGEPVQMAGNALYMIHNVSGGMFGDAEDLRRCADTMDKIQSTIERTYTAKTGLSRKRVKEMMDAETWMTASEAKELGFIDEITGDLDMAARFDLTKFKNAGELTSRFSAMAKTTELEARIATLENTNKELVSSIEAKDAELNENGVKVTTAETKLSETDTELKAVTGRLGEANQTISKLENEKSELTKEIEKITAELAEAKKDDRTADERSREIAARNGALLPKKDLKKNEAGEPQTMTRSDFDALKSGARMAFMKAGGKLTD
jgi:chromosome segregation ATPase